MDEVRKNILHEQELMKSRFTEELNESFSSVKQENQRGKEAPARVQKAEDPELQKAYEELFGENDELEKAVYADTAENRKLGRVGQEYNKKKKETTTSSSVRKPKSKREIEKRLFQLKEIGGMNWTEEQKKEYGELNKQLLSKKMSNVKKPMDYPSRQEEKEIRRMMEDDGLDPDELSEKTWNKYYKKVKQENQRGKEAPAR